jgi:hypothetical protein
LYSFSAVSGSGAALAAGAAFFFSSFFLSSLGAFFLEFLESLEPFLGEAGGGGAAARGRAGGSVPSSTA